MPLNDVPNPNQDLNITQNPIRQNFLSIQALGLGDNYLRLPTIVVVPTTANNQIAWYTGLGPVSGVPEWFIRRPSNATPYTFTEKNTTSAGGWTRLPSGVLEKWGEFTITGGGNTFPVLFPTTSSIPAFAAEPRVIISMQGTPQLVTLSTSGVTNLGFNIRVAGTWTGSIAVSYFAIGLG